MSRSLRFSRWRRLPGAHRIMEQRLPTHSETLQRFTIYLPGRLIDDAEDLARLDGVAHAQAYCERILGSYLRAEVARRKLDAGPPEPPDEEDLEVIAEELAGGRPRERSPLALSLPPALEGSGVEPPRAQLPAPDHDHEDRAVESSDEAIGCVLRHAGLSSASIGLLASLRRGQPAGPEVASELIPALQRIEELMRATRSVERGLAHALFRLAFESQVLITDAWPGLADNPGTLELVRQVQEGAERILSGVDVRYQRVGEARS